MNFKPVRKLQVSRILANGKRVEVGTIAQNQQGIFFQYAAEYLSTYGNLSPFGLQAITSLQLAAKTPHNGIHGVFADSLPDGWGLQLQDRIYRQHDILPAQLTAMDRLAFVGHNGIGALQFEPISNLTVTPEDTTDLATLGLQAQALFDGQTDAVLAALISGGSSGGARPKAQIYLAADDKQHCRSMPQAGDTAWLVKFTSQHLPLGHEEGLCEAAYLSLAAKADLQPPIWQLLPAPTKSGASHWLAVKRFDYLDNNAVAGRYHMHSACGLLDADYRLPSLDYIDLIKASRLLCQAPAVGQLQFRRAVFNLLACNQDDHSKNWAFLQEDNGDWRVAPFYDVTFSPHPFGEHATAFAGYGKNPPLKAIQKLAEHAGFGNWREALQAIQAILDVVAEFKTVATGLSIRADTIRLIEKQLNAVWQQSKSLLQQ